MEDQRTSGTATDDSVTDGQADLLDRMIRDAMKSYPGGKEKAELAKGHPDFKKEVWGLLDRLSAERALLLPLAQRPAWMTIQRTCQDAAGYTADLTAGGFRIGSYAASMMAKPDFMKGSDVDSAELGDATVKELTGKDRATTAEVFAAIQKVGDLCPAWVGPELRKQYPDQPKGEWRIVAMEPIADSDGYLRLFHVEHYDGVRWLLANYGYPDRVWYGDYRFVFLRRK